MITKLLGLIKRKDFIIILLLAGLAIYYSGFFSQLAIISDRTEYAFGEEWRVVQGGKRTDCPPGTASFGTSSIVLGGGGGSCEGVGINTITNLGPDVTDVLVVFSGSVQGNRDGTAGFSIGNAFSISAGGFGFGDNTESKTAGGSLTFTKKGGNWDVYMNGVIIQSGIGRLNSNQYGADADDFEITFSAGQSSSQGSSAGSVSISAFTVVKKSLNLAAPTNIPNTVGLSKILQIISAWFNKIWTALPLTITGQSEYTLPDSSVSLSTGALVTYNIVLDAPTPLDETYSDGTYQVRYCTAGMVRKDGFIHSYTQPERCINQWRKDFQTSVPSIVGDYAVVAIMTQFDGVYESGLWRWSDERIVAQEALNVKTKAPIPGSQSLPQPGFLQKFISSIINFLKNIFGG